MNSSPSLDALTQVLDRYPAFARLLVDHGDWWRMPDGGTRFRLRTTDFEAHREAFAAFAAAMVTEIDEMGPDDEDPFPDPSSPPMTYRELRALDQRLS